MSQPPVNSNAEFPSITARRHQCSVNKRAYIFSLLLEPNYATDSSRKVFRSFGDLSAKGKRSIECRGKFELKRISILKILQKNLLLKALSSKRLLVDHVEIIEDSLNDLLKGEVSSRNLLTLLTTSGALATSYVLFIHFKQK